MKVNIQLFAVAELTPQKVEMNIPKVAEFKAGDTDGVTLVQPGNDESTMIVVYNSNAGTTARTLTISKPAAGKGAVGVSSKDITVSIPAGQIAMVQLESAKFLDVTTGKINMDVDNAELKFIAFYNK
jgi:hypothetical protein